jgi:5-(carboxyamino)imidazole ribonucleotide synthase
MILPSSTLGVLGGGQLGRMFTVAAQTMGYQVVVLDPDPHSPAGVLAERHVQADYIDSEGLQHLAQSCAAVTTEFENVPAESLRTLAAVCPVRPAAQAVERVQNRLWEKTFLREQGFATAPFVPVTTADEAAAAWERMRHPAILKGAVLGYDGKGQRTVTDSDTARAGFAELGQGACVLEQRIPLQLELSVVLARSVAGACTCYPVAENEHVEGILDTTLVPARVSAQLAHQATEMAIAVAEALDYCGVLAVELFLSEQDELLINEIAPRPHNSGHFTLDACVTSQFEQQVRMLCGLPPGDPSLLSPVVMVNLLGDLWRAGPPPWEHLFRHPQAKLHLYGKREARAGRKMGHCNCLATDLDQALALARHIRAALERQAGSG